MLDKNIKIHYRFEESSVLWVKAFLKNLNRGLRKQILFMKWFCIYTEIYCIIKKIKTNLKLYAL